MNKTMGQDKADYTFKLIIIGDSGVGKSCIIN
jgi:GTPase SAR1 family protein